LATLILLAAMFVLLWVLLIRPQRRKQLDQQNLLSSIEPGDEVLTVGGIYGIVTDIDDEDDLIVEIAEGIQVRIARRAVGGVVKPDEEDEDVEEGVEDDVEDAGSSEDAADADVREDGVVDSEEIVKSEVPEDTAALERR
jgi:preprotein translocase subunit YajC